MQPLVESRVRQIVDALDTALDCQSIWLLGSTARGEASLLQHRDGSLELFSDIEVMAVVPKRPPHADRQRLTHQIAALEQNFRNPNPLFHIDILIREQRRLRKLPPIIFTYELKQNARLLHGEDVRDEIPDVTLANLDFHNTHEILYKRLWAILLHLPKRFVLGTASEAEHRVAGYVLCRNALDLTTVLLPHKGVLLPTYRQRVAYVRERYADLQLAQTFGPDFPDFLQACLNRRLDLDFTHVDLHERYQTTLDYLERGLIALLPPGAAPIIELPKYSRRIFNEKPISRGEWYNLARLTLTLTRRHGPARAFKWLRLLKKGWLTLGLLSMHNALLAWFAGQTAVADDHLSEAANILETLSLVPTTASHADFTTRWLDLRLRWAEFWQQYLRMGDTTYTTRFQHILEWTQESKGVTE